MLRVTKSSYRPLICLLLRLAVNTLLRKSNQGRAKDTLTSSLNVSLDFCLCTNIFLLTSSNDDQAMCCLLLLYSLFMLINLLTCHFVAIYSFINFVLCRFDMLFVIFFHIKCCTMGVRISSAMMSHSVLKIDQYLTSMNIRTVSELNNYSSKCTLCKANIITCE